MTSTRLRNLILAKHAPEILEREKRRPPSASAVARGEKIEWLRAVAREEPDGSCRDWPWGTNNRGYGAVRWNGRTTKVTHVVLELAGSPRPDPGAFALHSCDRPACVAPWHLRWGTPADNSEDAMERDRVAHNAGTVNGLAKLTEADVLAIRASGDTLRSLGKQYDVAFSTIWQIRQGNTWRHVEQGTS